MKNIPRSAISLSVLALAVMATASLAQPENPARPDDRPRERRNADSNAPDREPPRGRLELEVDPQALRVRLQRTIARSEEMLSRTKAALEKLDAGATASEVLNELRIGASDRGQRDPARSQRMGDAGQRPEGDANRDETKQDEEREQMHAFLQTEFPSLWKNLAPILEQDPRSADRLLGRMAPQIREILFLQEDQPDLAVLKIAQMHAGLDFVEAARNYRVVISNPKSTDSAKADAREKLAKYAAERFDVELRAKQHEVDRLEARLTELRASVEQVEAARDQEITQMVSAAERNAQRQSRQRGNQRGQQSGDD